jgi:hypothetical protein
MICSDIGPSSEQSERSGSCSGRRPSRAIFLSQMNKEKNNSSLDEAMLAVWRQVLVERKKRVVLGDDSYPVQSTAKRKLAQVDFDFAGQRIRALEQNPATASRWAALARKGAKVMQFLVAGRYIAAVSDGKITHFSAAK